MERLSKSVVSAASERPYFFVVLGFLWQMLFFYVPLVFVIILSFMSFSDHGVFSGFSLSNFTDFFDRTYLYVILKSLGLALLNSFLCFLVGYPLAYFLSFKAGRFKDFFLFLLILPFWTNLLLHIYSWFYVLERSGFLNTLLLKVGIIQEPLQLLNSIWAVIAVMLYCYLPFMVLPIYSMLDRLNRSVIEASFDLGGSLWQTWKNVILPLSMVGVQSGFFLVFVPSFGEFAIPGLIGGEKYMFVGTVITQYILGARTMALGAAFTLLACLVLIMIMTIGYLVGRRFLKYIG